MVIENEPNDLRIKVLIVQSNDDQRTGMSHAWKSVVINMVHLLALPTINFPRSHSETLCSFSFSFPLQINNRSLQLLRA